MPATSLLYEDHISINDSISVRIPTVGQILDDEANYYSMVHVLTGMPIDFMVQLDDVGIDFTTINEYELFLMMFPGLQANDTSLIFGDLNLKEFELGINQQNDTMVLHNRRTGVTIDRAIHGQIADALRKIHHLEKNIKKPGNKEAREFMIERARKKQKRMANKPQESQLEEFIVALVCTEQYKYNYMTTRDLTIYQFNESLQQIIKKIDYDNRIHAVYVGTLSAKDMKPDDLNWLTHK